MVSTRQQAGSPTTNRDTAPVATAAFMASDTVRPEWVRTSAKRSMTRCIASAQAVARLGAQLGGQGLGQGRKAGNVGKEGRALRPLGQCRAPGQRLAPVHGDIHRRCFHGMIPSDPII
jgi:hypothetical protein